ncbi:MAG: hypothetical protein ACK56F_08400 [bacterium]
MNKSIFASYLGSVHTIINNNNWYNVGPKGQIEWFNKNSRVQYGIEGIILSFLSINL